MVRISELHESDDDSMERLNLDDYNSYDYDDYLSDNMETTPSAVTEVKATMKKDPPAAPPAATVTVQLEEEPVAEDLYECHCLLNQKRAFSRQRVANHRQEQQGNNYDYSNIDLCNVINIGRDARNVIISMKKELGGNRGLQPLFKLSHPSTLLALLSLTNYSASAQRPIVAFTR